jgi:outer membrane protein TolC
MQGCCYQQLALRTILLISLTMAIPMRGVSGDPISESVPAPPAEFAPRCYAPRPVLEGPIVSDYSAVVRLPATEPEEGQQSLPINLATALRLSDARPIVIAAAQASVQVAIARLDQAKVMWLPNLYMGGSYYRHDGGNQGVSGTFYNNSKNQLMIGAGPVIEIATTDAIFTPLAARQALLSRNLDLQSARNDALLNVAEAYFRVQQARGRLAGYQDIVDKGQQLNKTVYALAEGLVSPDEVNRVRTTLASLEQSLAIARGDWGVSSADLTRVLRLDPTAIVMPNEPPHLQITLISTEEPPGELIPIALTGRPELASQQALVRVTLVRMRQERMRPLLPSILVLGDAVPTAPGGYLMGGFFQSNVNGQSSSTSARNDVSVELLWALNNMGFGNRALVRERQAEQQQALVEFYRIQDTVAAEVVRAHAELVSAAVRVKQSEAGVQQAQISYAGNVKGLSETTRFADILVLVNRPQEVVAALQQLGQAYDNYFTSVNDYNRAQFRLYRALGYPANILAYQRSPGEIQPVNTNRPAMMAPVCTPQSCGNRR